MRDKPDIGAAGAPSHDSFGSIADDHPGNSENRTAAEQRRETLSPARERPPTPSPWAQAFNAALAAELDALSKRRRPSVNQTRPYTREQGAAPNTDAWRDQLLAEIEALIEDLQRKTARFVLFCAVTPTGEASAPDNAAAVEWMHRALKDLAPTARGMQMACEETFRRASQADILRADQAEKRSQS